MSCTVSGGARQLGSCTLLASHVRAILSCGFVSDAWYGIMTDGVAPGFCSHCNMSVVPTFEHLVWQRQKFFRGRPTRPSCELEARCGWPAEGQDPTTLRFLAAVRQLRKTRGDPRFLRMAIYSWYEKERRVGHCSASAHGPVQTGAEGCRKDWHASRRVVNRRMHAPNGNG